MNIKSSVILVLAATTLLWSCGTIGSSGNKEGPLVYYAAEDGLKLYPAPSFYQEPIAELPMNEKVLRYRTEKRFGYVKVERTGQEGWVENARLKWRIEKQKIEPETALPQEQLEKPPDQLAPEPSQDKTKTGGVLSPKEAEAATPPESSTPSKSKKKPDASVLDSY